jgi:hypothetical protein
MYTVFDGVVQVEEGLRQRLVCVRLLMSSAFMNADDSAVEMKTNSYGEI